MGKRVLKVLAVVAVLAVVLIAGAVAGGISVYGLARVGGAIPFARAQTSDPGYGVVIASVETGGPADSAGVVRGDILLELDGERLDDVADLRRILDERGPGDAVEMKVLHGDEERTLTATLDERGGRAYLGIAPCGTRVMVDRCIELTVVGAGAVVVEVMDGSPADTAGIQVGDVIVAVNGQELGAEANLTEVIAGYKPGDAVTLDIERAGEELFEQTVTLGENPDEDGGTYLGVRYRRMPHARVLRGLPPRGFQFDLPFGLPGDEFRFEPPSDLPGGETQQGVVVRSVDEGSPAEEAGLVERDVITAIDGAAVESPEALSAAIAERAPGDSVSLSVYRPDDETVTDVEVVLGEHPDDEDKAYLGVTVGGLYRMWRYRGDGGDLPRWRFQLPFGLELPFKRHFEFRWSPGNDGFPGEPGCSGDSI